MKIDSMTEDVIIAVLLAVAFILFNVYLTQVSFLIRL